MLKGKRYLLVLDDVWDEDQERWEMLKSVLACGSKGASIIITTRLENVASVIGTLPPHHLSFLSDDDCWLLFRQRAFQHENEENPKLVAIGKEIVKKCGCVPLAAKALGGLMRPLHEETEWVSIRESEIWNLPQQNKNPILPALRLSYYNLPLELRRCFVYCAIFPKGSKIEKQTLVQLWMANGYISYNRNLEMEDIGDEICRELYWRSLFQDVEEDEYTLSTRFKMHDLVHYLAQSIMEGEYQIMEVKSSTDISNKRARHVKLVGMAISEIRCDSKNFGFVRVFDASSSQMTKVPSSIGNLKHLRYLDFSWNDIRQLPDSICKLWNLQTLILDGCQYLERLPKNMRYLTSLRHLFLHYCPLIDEMPPKIGQLTCLKTLSLFVVDKSGGCGLSELQCLILGGDLRIKHLERVRNPIDAFGADLVGKQNLRQLELCWESNADQRESQENVEKLLEALKPHPNLMALLIEGYRGTHFPLWMSDSTLQNISEIELTDCKNCSQLPPFGRLPLLRRLAIRGMDNVQYVDNDFPGGGGGPVRGFPSLQILNIEDLPNLKGFSREEGRELLPCLLSMEIGNCPKLSFPFLSSPKKLKVRRKCTNVVLNSISNLSSLTELCVQFNEEAISFPEEVLGKLIVLESLSISSFKKLKTLPKDLASLVTLKSFDISNCPELESLPEQGLRGLESLRDLQISYCDKFSSFSEGLRHLTALEILKITRCPQLVGLPDDIKNLNSLQRLNVYDLPGMTSLPDWLGNLTSLE